MSGKTIPEFTEITTVAPGDKMVGVDVSDTTASSGGTNKHFTKANLLKEYATLTGEETLTNKTLSTGSVVDANVTVIEVLKKVYPVGSIYTNATSSTNPNTLFGFGTWVAFGAGRVIAGYDSTDADFNEAEETGGAKDVTLTAAQSGTTAHSHTTGNQSASHTHGLTTHGTPGVATAGKVSVGTSTTVDSTTTGIQSANHTHTVNNSTAASASEAHSNLQPYITVYLWKRTA
jgi:hypothetical protein